MSTKPKTSYPSQNMKISQNKKHFQISFDSNNEVSANSNNPDHEEQKDIIQKFIQPCPYFQFPTPYNEETLKDIQREADKLKQRVTCFNNQYGTRNQKTTAIFLNLLEVTRQLGTNQLKKKQYMNACYFYAMCLGFIDPDDQIFLEKFIITKIDIVNKLMFSLFQLKPWKTQNKYLQWSQSFLQDFLKKAKQYAFQSNLRKSDTCMIELNYFYLGRVYKKRKNYQKAIQSFHKTQEIITQKNQCKTYEKNQLLGTFAQNLEIKTFYKISKCYRFTEPQSVRIYESRALTKAQQYNPALFQYLNKKIRMYYSAKQFNLLLNKIEGKKRIEQQVLKLIQDSHQKQFSSLYDLYKDNPNKINLKGDEKSANQKCDSNNNKENGLKLSQKRSSSIRRA